MGWNRKHLLLMKWRFPSKYLANRKCESFFNKFININHKVLTLRFRFDTLNSSTFLYHSVKISVMNISTYLIWHFKTLFLKQLWKFVSTKDESQDNKMCFVNIFASFSSVLLSPPHLHNHYYKYIVYTFPGVSWGERKRLCGNWHMTDR